ncbi:uncharacterized protein LOC100908074 [Galendromus occidentalis]|uniref:Uncharacterized protein LOC100908074 n=1 Tax=Galendromus occidentalis TaxID=34638 RepID=A0AAJ6QRL3_9ACAR|nr:uncharacterized protein LOC100908074 [Galendromus occidentalis]
MRSTFLLLSGLASVCFAAWVPNTFNPCALDAEIMETLINCGLPKAPPKALEIWNKRTLAIPGMSATDLILEVCRINGNAGYTLWSQMMSEYDPEDAAIVDKNAYDCLKQYNLLV